MHIRCYHNEQQNDLSNHPLIEYSRDNKNLIITPHMAGLTFESENIAADIIFNLLKMPKKNCNLADISILVCTYNHASWIERCIRSLLNQNYINSKILRLF